MLGFRGLCCCLIGLGGCWVVCVQVAAVGWLLVCFGWLVLVRGFLCVSLFFISFSLYLTKLGKSEQENSLYVRKQKKTQAFSVPDKLTVCLNS